MLSAVEWTERDVALYRAVTEARRRMKRGDRPSDAAAIACDDYAVSDQAKVRRLAVSAEQACAPARVWIKENVK